MKTYELCHMTQIHQIVTENLIDRLNIYEKILIGKLCEDYVYSKHIVHPYNNNKLREKEILKHIYQYIGSMSGTVS